MYKAFETNEIINTDSKITKQNLIGFDTSTFSSSLFTNLDNDKTFNQDVFVTNPQTTDQPLFSISYCTQKSKTNYEPLHHNYIKYANLVSSDGVHLYLQKTILQECIIIDINKYYLKLGISTDFSVQFNHPDYTNTSILTLNNNHLNDLGYSPVVGNNRLLTSGSIAYGIGLLDAGLFIINANFLRIQCQ